eukprot:s1810_g7.t1
MDGGLTHRVQVWALLQVSKQCPEHDKQAVSGALYLPVGTESPALQELCKVVFARATSHGQRLRPETRAGVTVSLGHFHERPLWCQSFGESNRQWMVFSLTGCRSGSDRMKSRVLLQVSKQCWEHGIWQSAQHVKLCK